MDSDEIDDFLDNQEKEILNQITKDEDEKNAIETLFRFLKRVEIYIYCTKPEGEIDKSNDSIDTEKSSDNLFVKSDQNVVLSSHNEILTKNTINNVLESKTWTAAAKTTS